MIWTTQSSTEKIVCRWNYSNRNTKIGKNIWLWSCPPLQIDADAYLSKYAWVNVVGAKIILDHKVIEKADTPEKIKTVGWTIVSEVKLMLEEEMRKLESQLPGSVSLSSGGCSLCGECTRKTGKTCRQVDKMRYSMDAFGFDLSAITKDMLGIEIMWCKDRLPDYFTLIHGILTREVAFPPAIRHLK